MSKHSSSESAVSRRDVLRGAAAVVTAGSLVKLAAPPVAAQPGMSSAGAAPNTASVWDIAIGKQTISVGGRETSATLINGTLPGPLLRFREGEAVTVRVRNDLAETTSIHWHGVLVPFDMDGVPGVSFPGIKPGETFTYRYTLRQYGTYWYHSHSGVQEQSGVFGPLVIDPIRPDPFAFDREHIVMLSDWPSQDPHHVMAKLKKSADYYNFQKRTVFDFFRDIRQQGWRPTVSERAMWARMRMDPTDILDVTGYTYTYLANGQAPASNWTALFRTGERVRLRFINSAAMTIFDVRIPGLKLTVVQADGQNVDPVSVDEFRIGVAETYDVIVEPREDRAYTIFAEAMDRSGYAAATLAPRVGMRGDIPPRRPRPVRSMADMGMGDMPGMPGMSGTMSHSTPKAGAMPAAEKERAPQGGEHSGHSGTPMPGSSESAKTSKKDEPVMHGPDKHGPGNSMVAEMSRSRLDEPGTGLDAAERRVLVYTDLRRRDPDEDQRPPTREIEMHLTGNMERQMWSIDGKKFSEAPEPIPLGYKERVRITLVNDTMMEHPMHLHGMWMVLENGAGAHLPYKHTILVKPAERLSVLVGPDDPGPFAFHCHLLFHMEFGMFRVFTVAQPDAGKKTS